MNLFEMDFEEVGSAVALYVVHSTTRVAARFSPRTVRSLAVRAIDQKPEGVTLRNARARQMAEAVFAANEGRCPPSGNPCELIPVTRGTDRLIAAAAVDHDAPMACHLFVWFH